MLPFDRLVFKRAYVAGRVCWRQMVVLVPVVSRMTGIARTKKLESLVELTARRAVGYFLQTGG
jgi:hypothetical protein